MKESVLSIDIGTTSLKAAVINAVGEVASFSRVEYSSLSSFCAEEKHFSQNWLSALHQALLVLGVLPKEIVCAAISGNGPTLVAQDGTTLLWNEKVPSTKDQLQKEEEAQIKEKLEQMEDSHFAIYLPRAAAFKKMYPASWEGSKVVFTAPGFLSKKIAESPKDFSLQKGVQVFATGPDFAAALIGSATLFPGAICDRAGSSEGLNLCAPFPLKESSLKGLRQMPSPASGLWNVSYLIEQPGKSAEEKAKNFLKGITLLKKAAEKNSFLPGDSVFITGGQARSQDVVQKKCDKAGIKIHVAQIEDAELLGNAAIAFTHLGVYKDIQEAAKKIVRIKKTFYPATYKIVRMPKKVSAIIFDIDSTLYTNPAYAFEQVDCQVREFAKMRGISNEDARKMVSDYRKKFAEENGGKKISLCNTLKAFGVPIEQSIEWRRTLLNPSDYLARDEELIEALKLVEGKFRLICVTNNPVLPAKKTLCALGIEDLIPTIIGLDTSKKSKPDKEPFLLALKALDVPADQVVSVGDRYDLDIAPALELGMGGILVKGVQDVDKVLKMLYNKV